jgi:hypothetical protein
MSTESVVLIALGMMGGIGIWQLNCIRADLTKFIDHLTNRNLHTMCGKEHEQ